jgi:hypothetical protein
MPCIRRLRILVATVIAIVADGMSADEILAAHPDLEREEAGDHRLASAVVRTLGGSTRPDLLR